VRYALDVPACLRNLKNVDKKERAILFYSQNQFMARKIMEDKT
jgi:hypothetical protein